MSTRISEVTLQNFRGVSGTLTISFCTEVNKSPQSLILFGDNGTGKSSIVDAIEFGLQGRLGQRSSNLVPAIPSFSRSGACSVNITFSDNTNQERSYPITDLSSKAPHPSYSISPFVLRRADILHFWEIADHERQLIFLDYLKLSDEGDTQVPQNEQQALEQLNQSRFKLKNKRRGLAARLAKRLNLNPEHVPLGELEFDTFARDRVYNGLTNRQKSKLRLQGKPIPVDAVLDRIVKKIRNLTKQINDLNKETRGHKLQKKKYSRRKLHETLVAASEQITAGFLSISSSNAFVDKIELIPSQPTEVSLLIKVHLKNGKVLAPKHIFSEANLDLLALLVFLAFVKASSEMGQSKLVILDDVLQSVDATIRLRVADYILSEFSDWMIIFTVHDRLWLEQLRDVFRRHNHAFIESEIVRWDFNTGPVLIMGNGDIDSPLKDALFRGEINNICSQAGLLLERICNALSYTLAISVTRRRGDKYTLGDLWPGVSKAISKTASASVAKNVNDLLQVRNLVGAHYNEWGQSLTNQDAQLFGKVVMELYSSVRCSSCFQWIGKSDDRQQFLSCRCGKLFYLIGKR